MRELERKKNDPTIVIEIIYDISLGDHENCDIKFSDFPEGMLPTDTIDIVRMEGSTSDGNWYDGETKLLIYREREETKEEEEYRRKKASEFKEDLKNRRRITYLNFRKEFKDEDLPDLECHRKYSLGCNYGKCDCKPKTNN